MAKIGLVAGEGFLPVEFVRSVKKAGDIPVVFAIEGMASRLLEGEADRIYWLNLGQFKKFIFLLLKERIRRLALLGKVRKNIIYEKAKGDDEVKDLLESVRDNKDYSILEEITRRLGRFGIEVIDGMRYLSHLVPAKGVLGRELPTERVEEDIQFGYSVSKKLAGMDIGQTVVVKDKVIVAVEAMEGTNATISRARSLAGEGCVMVKVSRPDQDLRWDVPTVGVDTINRLSENGFSALAIESGRMFLVEKDKLISAADSRNIVIKVL